MATAALNPSDILKRQLIARLAQGQQAPGAPGAPGAGGTSDAGAASGAMGSDGGDAAGQQLSAQFAELQGADPQFLLRSLQQLKGLSVALYNRTVFTIPSAGRHLAQMQKSLDAAMKEIETASATQNAVRPQIANRAGMPNPGETPGGGVMPQQEGL